MNSRSTSVPRASIEQLVEMGKYLSISDQALLTGVYERGMTPTSLARISGETPAAVTRRLKRLLRRIGSPTFRFAARNLEHWPADRRVIAQSVLLHGQSQRRAAAALQISVHRVRREIDRIKAQIESSTMRTND